jgi:hypothetical protein
MGILFILIAVGFIANKCKLMSGEANRWITKLVINIAMPCTILNSVVNGTVEATGTTAAIFFLLCIVSMALGLAIAYFIPNLLKIPKSDRGLYRFMLGFANVGFMGYPVCEAIFGAESSFYVALFNILFSILSFSLGIGMIAGKKGKFNIWLIINPSFVGAIITLIIFLTGIKLPSVLCGSIDSLGKITTPAAMLIIGSTLAMIPIKEVISDWKIYPITFVKLFVIPIITYFVLRLFLSDPLQLGILTVLSAMPTATTATMLCMEYGGNETDASKVVFMTTLLSIVTIPLVAFILF